MSARQKIMEHMTELYSGITQRVIDPTTNRETRIELKNKLDVLQDLFYWIKENTDDA